VRLYVLARAAGVCESCNQPAPFMTAKGQPYLEPHHTRRLSDGGPDDPRFVGAVCPSCHREIHHGMHGQAKNDALIVVIQRKETTTR
jgi:5-methylcytosine-specific restriction protein A